MQMVGLLDFNPFKNTDHLQPRLFLTIQNPDWSGFQIPTAVMEWSHNIGVWQPFEIQTRGPSSELQNVWILLQDCLCIPFE